MTILQIVSCRGWSSDAYWAARAAVELERAGQDVTLVCKRRSEERVMRRAREAGVNRIESLALASGVDPLADARDLRRLVGWLPQADVLHVHRGKEHWLAALANRLSRVRRPLVRTRHIVQPVRPHALNRWLYRRATDQVVTVTEAIRRQLVAAGLVDADRVAALAGGVDAARFRPGAADPDGLRGRLGVAPGTPIVGLVFRHGAFTNANQELTAQALLFYVPGLPFGRRRALHAEPVPRHQHQRRLCRLPQDQRP